MEGWELELFHQLLVWRKRTRLVSELLWLEKVSVSDAGGPGKRAQTLKSFVGFVHLL